MRFAGVSYLAVFSSAVAGWIVGAVYYGLLSKPWLAAQGKTEEDIKKGQGTPAYYAPFVIAFVAELFMAWGLAGIVGHLGPGQVTIRNAVISAFLVWLCFVLATMVVNNAFGQRKPMLTVIDSGHWLAVLIVMGVIIGAFGA